VKEVNKVGNERFFFDICCTMRKFQRFASEQRETSKHMYGSYIIVISSLYR